MGTTENKGRKQTTALETRHLLKPCGNRPTCIRNRSPGFVQDLPLIRPELTPTAEPIKTVSRPRHKRMNTGLRCLQSTGELQLPAMLGMVWARSQDHLSETAKATTIDAVDSDQGRTAGVEDPGISVQPTDQLNGAAIQQGWIMGAW